jgi:hypothetical protein
MTIDARVQRLQGALKQLDRVQQQGWSTADARAARAESIRRRLDRGDGVAEVLRLLLEVDDHESPIRALVEHCLTHGTSEECGRQPWMSASVGARLEPFILQAITCLVDEQILVEED